MGKPQGEVRRQVNGGPPAAPGLPIPLLPLPCTRTETRPWLLVAPSIESRREHVLSSGPRPHQDPLLLSSASGEMAPPGRARSLTTLQSCVLPLPGHFLSCCQSSYRHPEILSLTDLFAFGLPTSAHTARTRRDGGALPSRPSAAGPSPDCGKHRRINGHRAGGLGRVALGQPCPAPVFAPRPSPRGQSGIRTHEDDHLATFKKLPLKPLSKYSGSKRLWVMEKTT